jgi:hypothetical protein
MDQYSNRGNDRARLAQDPQPAKCGDNPPKVVAAAKRQAKNVPDVDPRGAAPERDTARAPRGFSRSAGFSPA